MFHFLFQLFHSWIKLFCAAAHPVTMQFDIITSNEAKYISLTAYLFQTSPSHKIYCYRSHSKIKWEWILSLSVIKELRSAYGNWGVEALVEANWHRKTDTETRKWELSLFLYLCRLKLSKISHFCLHLLHIHVYPLLNVIVEV